MWSIIGFFIVIAILGGLFGGNSFGESIRTGCGVVIIAIIVLVYFGAKSLDGVSKSGNSSPQTVSQPSTPIYSASTTNTQSGSTYSSSPVQSYTPPTSPAPTVGSLAPVNFVNLKVIAPGELNVRSGPGPKFDVVGKVYSGDLVEAYEQNNGWVKIDGGWVNGKYLGN